MMRDNFTETERARSVLWSLVAGCDRDTGVRRAMGARAAGLEFEDFLSWSEGAGNFKNEAECRCVWNSIKPGGVTVDSLFRAALAAGWQDGTEKERTERPQARQDKRKKTEAPKPTSFDPLPLWNACTPASATNEYANRKLGLHDGLREYHGNLTIAGQTCNGSLVLPCHSLGGELASLQFVPAEGKKAIV